MTTPKTPSAAPPDDTMLKAALAYAELGYSVVPLHTPIFKDGKLISCSCKVSTCPTEGNVGKHPRTMKGLKAATTDRDQIKKWWEMWPEANIGIVTGKIASGKDLVVIDVDTKHNGTDNWNAIVESHQKLPATAESITGSGGKHILFVSDVPVKCSVGLVSGGIDVRATGGYIVAPPSLHKSGKRYQWELSSDPSEVPLAPLPDWLLSLTGPRRPAPMQSVSNEDGKIPEGERNNKLFKFACSMRAKGAERSTILAALLVMNDTQCEPPMDPKSIEIIANQASSVPIGLSADVKEKIKASDDQQRLQKQRADEAKAAAKEAAAKAKAEAMKVSMEESRRGLQLVSHEFLAGSEKMEDPAEVAAREAARAAAIAAAEEAAARADAGESDETESGGGSAGAPPSDNSNGSASNSEGVCFTLSRGDSVELATLILRELRGKSSEPIVYDRAEFWYYNQHIGIWSLIERTILIKRISLYAGALIGDKTLCLSGGAINEAVKLASDYAYRRDFFNEAPTGILFKNGFVVVENGVIKLLPHSPEHRAIYRFEFNYDPLKRPDAWLEFLEQVFTLPTESDLQGKAKEDAVKDRADKIAFLQEHAGASLMGYATKYGVCAVLFGESASNGKSVYLEVIKSIFPTGSVTSVSPHDWTNRFFLAELAGIRLNVVDELPAKEIAESESFKSVVTGGHIMVHRKNGRPFNLVPNSGHIFACNALPGTRDQTDGFWRRFTVITFERKFEEKDRIIGLSEKLIETDMAGIAIWAIQGLARLQQGRMYTAPTSSVTAKTAWQLESDQVRQWMNECTVDDGVDVRAKSPHAGRMSARDAYTSYLYWVKVSSHGVGLSQQKFWKRLSKACESERKETGTFYLRRIEEIWQGYRVDPGKKPERPNSQFTQ